MAELKDFLVNDESESVENKTELVETKPIENINNFDKKSNENKSELVETKPIENINNFDEKLTEIKTMYNDLSDEQKKLMGDILNKTSNNEMSIESAKRMILQQRLREIIKSKRNTNKQTKTMKIVKKTKTET